MYPEDGDAAQRSYQENVFVGVGEGSNYEEASRAAFADAWERAKNKGKAGKPLRVQDMWVRGENPIGWCKVVLSDDNP